MDEVKLRSIQKLDDMQVQLSMGADSAKAAFQQYSENMKAILSRLFTSRRLPEIKETLRDLWLRLLIASKDGKDFVIVHFYPHNLYNSVKSFLQNKWTRHNLYFGCVGLIVGALIGYSVGVAMQRHKQIHYMQAIQCTHYGTEMASVIEDVLAPHECGSNQVLISVKAASVQIVDAQICAGYGRRIRKCLRKYFEKSPDLPVTLGRDCSGVIIDIGRNVKRLDVGDEVYVVAPFWATGTLSHQLLVAENRVSRKPRNTGFEGACSLPYAGCIALGALKKANLNAKNAHQKRVFIQGGCTPVGCILIQILKHWNALVTTTCFKRAVQIAQALGATDIICFSDNDNDDGEHSNARIEFSEMDTSKFLMKHLSVRERFDVIVNTRECGLYVQDFLPYCNEKGIVVSTLLPNLPSDSYGPVIGACFAAFLRFRLFLQNLLGAAPSTFGEASLYYKSLEKLSTLAEEGHLQTVVDKVFHPPDIQLALNHIQSSNSIGSTVITFR